MKKFLGIMLIILTTVVLVGCSKDYYTVSFDTNGSKDVIESKKVGKGEKVSKPTELITKDGYVLEYWTLNDSEFLFDEYIVESDIELVAKWRESNGSGDGNGESESEVELSHEFDFSILGVNKDLVTTPSTLSVINKIDASKAVEFERLNSTIDENTYMDLKGVILNSNDKTKYGDAYFKTTSAIKDLMKIEIEYGVWGQKDQQNMHLVEGVYVQTSTDGLEWVTQKNIKEDVLNEGDFRSKVVVEGNFGTSFVRIFAKASGATSEFQMRFIIGNIKFHTMGEVFTGQTYTIDFDYGYEGAPEKTTQKVREGKTANKPQNPTRLGHKFLGWFEVGVNTPYDFTKVVNANVRLVAKWEVGNPGDNPSDGDDNITNYYNSLNGLTGSAFDNELRRMIKQTGRATGSTNEVKKADSFEGKNYNIYDGFGSYGNREHVWPNSKLGGAPKYDLHNLRAAIVNTNSTRSNFPFGEGSGRWKLANAKFYPGDEHVGDVARIVLYIHVRYGLNLSSVGNLNMFLKWHEADPVSDFERARNNNIQDIQGSRNPFIDYPEYVTILLGAKTTLEVTTFNDVYNMDDVTPIYLSFEIVLSDERRSYLA